MSVLPSVEELNKLSDSEFKQVVCLLFELAPPLEKRLIPKRPFESYNNLINSGRNGKISVHNLIQDSLILLF